MFSSSMLVLVVWLVRIIFFRLLCSWVGVSLCRVLLLFSLIIIIEGWCFCSRFGSWVSVLEEVLLLMLVLMIVGGGLICWLICC